jgi:hypothetical protein
MQTVGFVVAAEIVWIVVKPKRWTKKVTVTERRTENAVDVEGMSNLMHLT